MIIDLHVHTSPRSYCSALDPHALVSKAKKIGLDGICLTEHDLVWEKSAVDQLRQEYDFVFLRGMEVSTNLGHILVYGLEDYVDGIWRASNLRQVIDQAGGIMIAAHPFRDSYIPWRTNPEFAKQINLEAVTQKPIFSLVDGLEVLNGERPDAENNLTSLIAEKLCLKGTGGSDSHSEHALGRCVTEFESWIETDEQLIRELRLGRFRALNFNHR